MRGWRILHHVVAALTMTKIAVISTIIKNDAFLFCTSIKQDIDSTIIKELL